MKARAAWLGALLALCVVGAQAQLAAPDPDWRELEVPPPAVVQPERMLALEMPRHLVVRVGVDAESISIGSDGIVRFVAIAVTPEGGYNATYEGIRCQTGEVKVYARYGSAHRWVPVDAPEWRPLLGNQRSPHAIAFARQAACDGRANASSSAAEIRHKLKHSLREHTQR